MPASIDMDRAIERQCIVAEVFYHIIMLRLPFDLLGSSFSLPGYLPDLSALHPGRPMAGKADRSDRSNGSRRVTGFLDQAAHYFHRDALTKRFCLKSNPVIIMLKDKYLRC